MDGCGYNRDIINNNCHIELIVAIEEEFNIPKIEADDIVKMTSVSGIRDILKKYIK